MPLNEVRRRIVGKGGEMTHHLQVSEGFLEWKRNYSEWFVFWGNSGVQTRENIESYKEKFDLRPYGANCYF